MDEDLGTGDPEQDQQQRPKKKSSSDCDPLGDPCALECGGWACCESLNIFDGCSLVSLTALFAAAGGLLAAIAGAGPLGRRLKGEAQAPHAPLAAALHRGVRYYQLRISSRRPGYGGCRYTPTCSAYAAESLRRHGAVQGARLAVGRLRRCRPGAVGGVDPVPPGARTRHLRKR